MPTAPQHATVAHGGDPHPPEERPSHDTHDMITDEPNVSEPLRLTIFIASLT